MFLPIVNKLVGDLGPDRVLVVAVAQQRRYGQNYFLHRHHRRPIVTVEQAQPAVGGDVAVVDLRPENQGWRQYGVAFGENDVQFEGSACRKKT